MEVSGQVDSPARTLGAHWMGVRAGQFVVRQKSLAPAESRTMFCQLPSLLMSRSSRQQQSELISVLGDVCRSLTQSVYTIDGRVLRITSDRQVARPVQVMLYHTGLRQRC